MPENEVKKSGGLVKHEGPDLKREGLFSYFRNSWIEFKKVVWPERADAVRMTIFVVIFVAILAAFIYVVDSSISWLFFDVLLKRG
ncbi:preprotein translocase subunit SecE [Neisseria chenwenguii]|nr:preprotein translocase subunit SecE [Neisseria chenwenguii]